MISNLYNEQMGNYLAKLAKMQTNISGTETAKQTNADRIRSMTDEELAEWINEWFDCGNCAEFFGNTPCSRDKDCVKVWLEWLKEEVKE